MSATPDATARSGTGDAAVLQAPLVERILEPFARFAGTASAGGIVLLACTALALGWANSPWADAYHHLWETRVTLGVGGAGASMTLHHLVNDGLMAVFFFLVGLEIKREALVGELASLRQAALPAAAALGGMVVPAAIYAALNAGGPGAAGWGVPMATDIAFALGVLALLGDRVPSGLKILLAALAIVDDIGAVLVIALFYTGGVNWEALGLAAALLVLAVGANVAGVRRASAYAAIGVALWGAVLASGVHATVAGVLLAMAIPSRTRVNEEQFLRSAQRALEDFDEACDPAETVLTNPKHQAALQRLETLTEQAQAPLQTIEHRLHHVVAFAVMPLFALANAGVPLTGGGEGAGLLNPVALGVIAGLSVGKPVGIMLASWLAVRSGVAALPAGVTWKAMHGVSWLAGIGFTMSLFIAGLAFAGAPVLLTDAKLGILAASLLAGSVGWALLRRTRPADE